MSDLWGVLLGSVIGLVGSLGATWLAARQAQKARKDDVLLALRTAVIERHEERAVAEFAAYKDYVASSRRSFLDILMAAKSADPRRSLREMFVHTKPPPMVFVPTRIVRELAAASVEWETAVNKMLGAEDSLDGNLPLLRELYLSLTSAEQAIDPIMEKWADHLRSGAYVTEQARSVLESASSPALAEVNPSDLGDLVKK